MHRSFKFRMYPNKEQQVFIDKILDSCRFVYNYYLAAYKQSKSQKNNLTIDSCIQNLKANLIKEYQNLEEVENYLLIKTIYRLFDNIKKQSQTKKVLPQYKSKNIRNSITIQNTYNSIQNSDNIVLDLRKHTIKFINSSLIPIRGYNKIKRINGKIINATISKEPNGKYYISVLYKLPDINRITSPKTIVGLDIGVKNLITQSDGIIHLNNKYIEKYEKRIKKCQKELSRKQKGSNNYYKCKLNLSKLHTKLKNARKYHLHKITKHIVTNYDVIACEKLDVENMINKSNLSKKILDATFAEIIKQLRYKSQNYGKYFYQVPKFYPSSQICSICNNINRKYKDLTLRTYKCDKCNNIIDRDLNASINIMNEGLKTYMANIKIN